ncbi:hypothetical protein ACQFX9_06970 [Aliinostoc sp. HNIBRCY26]|uniref:hypothetical protein n=1 Tax=Aliinostoc sp. HNIBRCY26 TaxID=3418997 RepID=UPI003D08930F
MEITAPEESIKNGQLIKAESGNFQSIIQQINANNLDNKSIIDVMKAAIAEVVQLEITTWVEEPSTQPDGELQPLPTTAKPGNRIYTKINLIDGDIENEVGSQFLSSGPYAELLSFHLDQVKESREIMQKNIESVHKVYKILKEMASSRTGF